MPDLAIDPGELNVRVQWARASPNPAAPAGTAGQFRYTVVGDYWAKVETLRGAERFAAAQLRPEVDTKITMRDVGDVRPHDKLTAEGAHPRVYTVETPTRPGERPGWIVLTAISAVAP